MMRQLVLELLPPPAPGFDNFVAGDNAEVINAVADWSAGRGQTNCLLLWGETGCGRSHLLAASRATRVDARCAPDLDVLPAAVDGMSRIAVDNVEALSATGQIALFNLFNRLAAAGGRLLTSAALPPQQLSLREDLRTRLGSGLIFRLRPLTDTQKAQALRERALTRGLKLSDELIETLFRQARRDMGTLAALIDALDRFTLEHRRPVTLPLLRQLLAQSEPVA